MNGFHVLRAADRRPQPWKNGGGITSDIATFPSGTDMADFDWRISLAEVATAGPFSYFEGVDRVLTVLEGELALTFDGSAEPVRLTDRSAPYPFAGDVPVSGTPLGGRVRDLNVMVRRGRIGASVERIVLTPGLRREVDFPGHSVLVALGSVTVRLGDKDHRLADLDAIVIEEPRHSVIATSGSDGRLILIAFDLVD